MAISKQYLKSKPVCKVTFSVPAKDADEVTVVGTFNEWDTKSTTLKKLKNGTGQIMSEFHKNPVSATGI